MPAPQASLMKQITRAKFSSFGLRVPEGWQNPTGDPAANHYSDAFKPEEKTTQPDPTAPPLFIPASPNKYHTKTQTDLTKQIGGFLDKTCDAICSAWSQWQALATITGATIIGPVVTGGVVPPVPWQPFIMMQGAVTSPSMIQYTTTIATVLSTAWIQYTTSIKIPGLPLYPAFAAFPGPVAPPMPNVPVPLMSLTQVPSSMSASTLKQQMSGMHPPTPQGKKAQYSDQIFEAISFGVNSCFTAWQGMTIINNMLGTGPVPTFAPPYVPVGPVTGGIANMLPGGFT